jgi:hypothetical protein
MKLTTTVYREFLITCKANRGGKHLVPVSIQEIELTPDDPVTDYAAKGKPSPYFGEIREPLKKRGDLIETKCGDRITRNPHIGKQVRPGRNGKVFVQVRVRVNEWISFTRRTNNPKLQWLRDKCEESGLRVVQNGSSWHAPCTYVHRDDYDAAWAILSPVDSICDDAPRFRRHTSTATF